MMGRLFSILVNIFIISATTVAASEQQILLNIKSKLFSHPPSALASWRNDSLEFCQWRGVTCDDNNPPHVTALNLGSLGLNGSLSPDIAHLTFIEKINLQNNFLHGEIPGKLGLINGLRYLDLSYNRFYGSVPNSLYNISSLTYLSLYHNNLTGALPSNLGQRLPQLEILELGSNDFQGNLSNLITSLANCSALKSIDFSYNNLSGSLPNTIGNLSTKLEKLVLEYNSISGSIPREIGNLVNLIDLNLNQNDLEGVLPSTIGSLSKLGRMWISDNRLSGPIPDSIGNLTELYFLNLTNNELNGTIPASLGNCNRLQILVIGSNQLEILGYNDFQGNLSDLITILANCSALKTIDLSDNYLSSSLPNTIGNLSTKLEKLVLEYNYISGSIPREIENLVNLIDLNLNQNYLEGVLPSTIGSLSKLGRMWISDNRLSGPIPDSIGNLTELYFLNLTNNELNGTIPASLGNCNRLQILVIGSNQLEILGYNDFQGNLSNLITSLANCSALKTIDFSHNNLSGSLPNTIGNLSTKLEKLVLEYNSISGSIPTEIGNLVNLIDLNLNQNDLEGVLPSTIGSLSKLGRMQISDNRLSGPIPDSIGNLTELYFLNLTNNELNGTIPASLGNCNRLQILVIGSNQLEGAMPRELFRLNSQMTNFDASNNQLVGSIPDVSSMCSLRYLSLTGNNFTGIIPDSLGFCQSLEVLFLDDNFIQGSIPEIFKNMIVITYLGLSHNNLAGRIPEFFESFCSLQYLNLAFNNFDGEVPIDGIFFRYPSAVSLQGNQGLCSNYSELHLPPCAFKLINNLVPEASKTSSKIVVIISVIISIVVLICFCIIVIILYQLRRTKRIGNLHTPASFRNSNLHTPASFRNGNLHAPASFSNGNYKKISYVDIAKATGGFSSENLVGSGSFGSVYKGILDNKVLAVKVFDLEHHGALRSFNSECKSLRNMRHKNLVSVFTSCSSLDFKGNDFKSLLFEYIPNGSLEEWIHPKSPGKKLSWADGIYIAMDVASALNYLHHQCATPMVHCDIKPSNILIDTDMTALVSDFGLARFLVASHSTSAEVSTTLHGLKGTIGYIPPEYASGSTISAQGDTYSYGIVLLEMLTGKRPTDAMFRDGFNIHAYVSEAFPEKIIEILDPSMFEELKCLESNLGNANDLRNMVMEKCIIPLVRVGLNCSKEVPKDRMRMEDVAVEISKIKQNPYLGNISLVF